MPRSIDLLRVSLLSLVGLSASVGCGDDEEAASAPDGVACSSTSAAGSEAALTEGLGKAASGACVVVTGNITSATAFVVGAGVKVVGAKGTRPTITVTQDGGYAVRLAAGAQLGNLDVLAAPRVGVGVEPGSRVFDVKVSGAKNAAMSVIAGDAAVTNLDNVTLEKSGYGLIVTSGAVVMTGGRVAENGGTSLSSGAGVVASAGAQLTLDGVTVEKNEGTGVLLDGDKTVAVIKGSTVSENRERGIWAQGLQGTLESPALRIEETQVKKNRIVGVGGVELKGIIIVGGTVVETVAAPIPTNLATTEMIGDGVGLFGGSTDVKIERTNFAANERAAGVIDGSEVGIIIVGGTFPDSPGLKFVVQNSKADIQIADANKSVTDKVLGISAPKLKLPAAL